MKNILSKTLILLLSAVAITFLAPTSLMADKPDTVVKPPKPPKPPKPDNNILPIANAGEDQSVLEGDIVILDGSASADPDGRIKYYEWKEGDSVLSTDVIFEKSDFSVGSHTITLTVTDNKRATASDSMNVTVTDDPSLDPQPTINTVTDSLGNVQTNSWATGEGGSWPSDVPTPIVVNVGDAITFTVDATNPNDEVLEYKFAVAPPGGSFDTKQDWSTSNTFIWNVDATEYGPNVTVFIAVRNDDGRDYMGEWNGDDYTYATYDVDDPSLDPQPTINTVTDSLGNVQTNSWATGEGGSWPSDVPTPIVVNVGDAITFTVDATNPSGGVLEYKFSVQPPGGSFETKQDWSTSNTFIWSVDASEYGPNVIVIIAVRNDDGRDYMGTSSGDDYTYATYDVDDPSL